jgi:hypothetical protein
MWNIHINTKKHMYSTNEVSTQENAMVTHEAIQKYIHIYTPILLTYAIYTTFKG